MHVFLMDIRALVRLFIIDYIGFSELQKVSELRVPYTQTIIKYTFKCLFCLNVAVKCADL